MSGLTDEQVRRYSRQIIRQRDGLARVATVVEFRQSGWPGASGRWPHRAGAYGHRAAGEQGSEAQ